MSADGGSAAAAPSQARPAAVRPRRTAPSLIVARRPATALRNLAAFAPAGAPRRPPRPRVQPGRSVRVPVVRVPGSACPPSSRSAPLTHPPRLPYAPPWASRWGTSPAQSRSVRSGHPDRSAVPQDPALPMVQRRTPETAAPSAPTTPSTERALQQGRVSGSGSGSRNGARQSGSRADRRRNVSRWKDRRRNDNRQSVSVRLPGRPASRPAAPGPAHPVPCRPSSSRPHPHPSHVTRLCPHRMAARLRAPAAGHRSARSGSQARTRAGSAHPVRAPADRRYRERGPAAGDPAERAPQPRARCRAARRRGAAGILGLLAGAHRNAPANAGPPGAGPASPSRNPAAVQRAADTTRTSMSTATPSSPTAPATPPAPVRVRRVAPRGPQGRRRWPSSGRAPCSPDGR
ncbi:hypothetical protein NKH18_29940 [Streptomyces sp. M10(2022)]